MGAHLQQIGVLVLALVLQHVGDVLDVRDAWDPVNFPN